MRLASGSAGLPIDLIVAGWNVALAVAWPAAAPDRPFAWVAGGLHAAAAPGLLLLLARGRPGVRGVRGWLREGYPWLFWVAGWWEVGRVHELAGLASRDGAVARLDRVIFGTHLHLALPAAAPAAWLGEAMHLVYLSYYALVLCLPVWALLVRRRRAFRAATLGLVGTYLVCFAIYLVLPVAGPRVVGGGGAAAGPFSGFAAALREAGDSPGTAFPSSHVAGSFAAAFVAWGLCRRRTAALLTAWASAVAVSTIHTGNHYAVDALAGLGVVTALALMERWWPRPGSAPSLAARPAARRGGAPCR